MERSFILFASIGFYPIFCNKFDINTDMSSNIETFCNQKEIQVIGKLPFNPLIVEAMVNCQSITDYAPDSDISKQIRIIYSKLITDLS